MYQGYLALGGVELINAERTAAYVLHQAPRIGLKPDGGNGLTHVALEDKPYESPAVDEASWFNRFDGATDRFYGMVPLSIDGIGDSTYTATVVESTTAGGTTLSGRSGTRTIKVSGLLVSADELAAEAGLTWLRNALESAECSRDDACGGADLVYFLAQPDVCADLYSQLEGDGDGRIFGDVSGPYTATYRWLASQVPVGMPSHVQWSGATAENTLITWGARALSTPDILEQFQAVPIRRNYALNPTMRSDVGRWTAQYGTIAWGSTGGSDEGGYASVTPALATYDTTYGSGTYGAGPYGGRPVTGFGLDAFGISTFGVGTPDPSVVAQGQVVSDPFATPAGLVGASVAVRSTLPSTVRIDLIDVTSGAVLDTQTVSPNSTWGRYTLGGTSTGPTALRLFSLNQFDFDEVLATSGDGDTSYFDGTYLDDGYTIEWEDAPDSSISVARYDSPIEMYWPDSAYRPFLSIDSGSISNLRLTWTERIAITMEEQLLPFQRSFHNVSVVSGPQIIQRIDATKSAGGYFIQVEILLNAGVPYTYSLPVPVSTTPVLAAPFTDPTEVDTPDDDWLFDPNCISPTPPPSAPAIVNECLETVTSWERYYIRVPATDVADWAASVPTIGIDSHSKAITQVRVRFHPNPFGFDPELVDPAVYCADFIVSYIPAGTRLLLNGMVKRASASRAGSSTVPAEHLLYSSSGGPMLWPELTCGIEYVMTVDVPSPPDFNLFDIDVAMNYAE